MKFWPTKKSKEPETGRGGDAGEIFIAVRKIMGDGKFMADGGNGSIGGKGGRITLISEDNQFTGTASTGGGKSLLKSKAWHERWWGILILGIIASLATAIILKFL